MYRSKFKYVGQAGFILVLGLSIVCLSIGFLLKYGLTEQDLIPIVAVGSSLLFLIIFTWKKILTEMNEIVVTESAIEIKNPFTKRVNKIEKGNIKGFKDIFRNGYTVLIIDNNDKVVGKINDYYYQDFKGLIKKLEIKYLGRVPTFIDKIFKTGVEK